MSRFPARILALLGFIAISVSAFAQSYATQGGGAGCIGSAIGGLIGLAIILGLTYFVYTDAKKRGMDNPALWAVLTFFTGFIGLIIYLLVRKK